MNINPVENTIRMLQKKGIDLDVALFRVLHLVPAQVVAEAPVVLL